MGVAVYFFDALIELHRSGLIPSNAKTVELGNQRVPGYRAPGVGEQRVVVEHFIRHFSPRAVMPAHSDHPEGTLAGDIYRAAGFRYYSIDIEPGQDTLVMDLNAAPAPPELVGAFDLVTNFGTTEHVMNQLNAFRLMHDLARDGGIMIHQVPYAGHPDHCLFSYMPKFFWLLAVANRYEVLDFNFNLSDTVWPVPAYWRTERSGAFLPSAVPDLVHPNETISFILRKVGSSSFSPARDLNSRSLSDDEVRDVTWRQLPLGTTSAE